MRRFAISLALAAAVIACTEAPTANVTVDAGSVDIVYEPPVIVAVERTIEREPTTPPQTLLDKEMLATADTTVDHAKEGATLMAAGKVPEAIAAYRRALSQSANAAVWSALGEAYVKQGDTERGVACLHEAISTDVHHVATRRALTKLALDEQDGERARQHAEEWVRLEPHSPAARQALGRSYTQLRMWNEAIAAYDAVLIDEPHNAYAHNNLGFAALQLGQTEKALAHLERLVSLRPQQGFMFNNLGVAYERAGRHAEAHAAFARAAELSPKYRLAALNRDRTQRGLDHAQRLVAADTLLKLRDGENHAFAPLGGEPALDLPAMPR